MGKVKPASVQPNIAVSVLVVWRAAARWVDVPAAMGVNADVPRAFPSPQARPAPQHSGQATVKWVCTNTNLSVLSHTKE